jgi:hypothetical protein
VLNKCKGCDPGPLVDFTSANFAFYDVTPGTWYLNVKKEISGSWSDGVYWTITIPTWYSPTPSPTSSSTPTTIINTSPNDAPAGVLFFLAMGGLFALMIYYYQKRSK